MVFLLSNTPGHIVRFYLFAMSQLHANYKPGYRIFIIQNILQYLFYANFATNFLLYNASGRTFRNAMMYGGRRFVRRLTTGFCVDHHDITRRRSFVDQAISPASPAVARQSPAVDLIDTGRNRTNPGTNLPLIRLPQQHKPYQNG